MMEHKDPYVAAVLRQLRNQPIVQDVCPCCDSTNLVAGPLHIPAFFIERMLNMVMLDRIGARAIQCLDCHFVCSEFRYTDEQMQRYYHEYMQMESGNDRKYGNYVFHRIRAEGTDWTSLLGLYKQPWWINARKEAIVNVLKSKNINLSNITSVLDFGGDLGQYIPDEFNHARRHVVEIEDRNFVKGVTAVSSPDDCDPVDLVLCCHTLEHVSWPNDLVVEMKRYLKPGGLLYIEVPDETEVVNNSSTDKTTLTMHEHINIFWSQSLVALVERNGFEVVAGGKIPYGEVHKDLDPARAILARLL